jgi:hypothetical protein
MRNIAKKTVKKENPLLFHLRAKTRLPQVTAA